MTLNQLSKREIALHSRVVEIYDGETQSSLNLSLDQIHSEYRNIHQIYTDLSTNNIEGLKRGLFLQWYALAEPSYLTGISELNENAERKIIVELQNRSTKFSTDAELNWMLEYYLTWDWIFARFEVTTKFKKSKNVINFEPSEMKTTNRGQMGIYWNSII